MSEQLRGFGVVRKPDGTLEPVELPVPGPEVPFPGEISDVMALDHAVDLSHPDVRYLACALADAKARIAEVERENASRSNFVSRLYAEAAEKQVRHDAYTTELKARIAELEVALARESVR